MILVFDGDSLGLAPGIHRQTGNIEIRFSGPNKSADQYIDSLILRNRSKEIEIITNDNEIIKKAKQNKVNFIRSSELLKKINKRKKKYIENNRDEKEELYGKDREFFEKAFGVK